MFVNIFSHFQITLPVSVDLGGVVGVEAGGGAGVVVVLVLLGAAAAVAAVLGLAAVTVPLLPPLISILPATSRLQSVIVIIIHYFR